MSSSLIKTLKASKLSEQYIVTPRLNEFLMRTPNLVIDKPIADLIYDQITKQPRYRPGAFSSSSAGACLRRQVYQYLGIDSGGVNGPQLQSIFNDGTWRHLRWQATLMQAGIISHIEFPLTWGRMRSIGTVDGAGLVPADHPNFAWRGKEFGLELKGMNSWGWKYAATNGVKIPHNNQVHRYFLSSGFDLFVIIYENKDTQEWLEWVIEPDPTLMDEQREELRVLNEYVDKKQIPPMLPGCVSKKGPEWKKELCPFAGDKGVCVRRNLW
jgi:hypothetical protein